MSTRMHIVVSDELLARIDASLGPGQARADFVRRAVERQLAEQEVELKDRLQRRHEDEAPLYKRLADGPSTSDQSPAPAEQPDDALREVHEELRQESRAEAFRRAAGKKQLG